MTITTFLLRPGSVRVFVYEVIWSPDGGRIAYQSSDTGTEVKVASGFGEGRVVAQRPAVSLTTGNNNFPMSWSRDGKSILAKIEGVGLEHAYLALFNIGDPRATRLVTTSSNQTNGQISPDGKWLAYASDEFGESAVYVTTFPDAVGKWQVVGWRGVRAALARRRAGNLLSRFGRCPDGRERPPRDDRSILEWSAAPAVSRARETSPFEHRHV